MFKKLHRTRLNTFKDDEHALEGKLKIIPVSVCHKQKSYNKSHLVTRNKINEEYRKHQNVTDATAIEEVNIDFVVLRDVIYYLYVT